MKKFGGLIKPPLPRRTKVNEMNIFRHKNKRTKGSRTKEKRFFCFNAWPIKKKKIFCGFPKAEQKSKDTDSGTVNN